VTAPLLSISDLAIRIGEGDRAVMALAGVDLTVNAGEVVGLVGESGGGKSMIARAIVGLLPEQAHVEGLVEVDGSDVLTMSSPELARHRGGGAALCFQNPRSALSPVRTVGLQITDRLEAHQGMRGDEAKTAALGLLGQVGIRDPERRFAAYPHQMSGGMCQRVMIALSLACSPRLLLADEPTTGLDVTLTREILGLFRQAADERGQGVLLISHDLASISTVCDRVAVLYAGRVVESGAAETLLREPEHPYTRALLDSVPDIEGAPVRSTGGSMPLLRTPPTSCSFAPRCARADETCRSRLPVLSPTDDGEVACFHPLGEPADTDQVPTVSDPTQPQLPPEDLPSSDALVVDGIDVVFHGRFGSSSLRALHDVSLTVARGERVGIVGESGCGKSTLARVVTGLQPVSTGSVRVNGVDVTRMSGRRRRVLSRHVQMVFQDPHGALSPRRTVLDAVGEPLRARGLPRDETRRRAADALQQTGLDPSIGNRRPSQLSGGQAQRVGIARALVVDPDLVVLDEPTSALDVTVQAQVLDLIRRLAAQRTRSYLFISHDLATVRGFCDRVVVLYLGRVVEEGPVERVFADPRHPYTRALLASAPRLNGSTPESPVRLTRDVGQAESTEGCPLVPRCPFAVKSCAEPQPLREVSPGHRVACHRAFDLALSPAALRSAEEPLHVSSTERC
jgi:oligopeptide/dipeptide ABC transporter ATP-binding protein